MEGRRPLLSVVVSSYGTDRIDLLPRVLEAVADGAPDATELIVLTDRPDAVGSALPEASDPVEVRVEPFEGGVSAERNAGLDLARGECVALLDDDMVPAPGWTRTIDRLRGTVEDAIYTGPVLPSVADKDGAFPHLWIVGCRRVPEEMEVEGLYGGNLVLFGRARELRFDERLGPRPGYFAMFEDTDFCHRALDEGLPVRAHPDLTVRHVLPADRLAFGDLVRRAWRTGRSARLYQRFATREDRTVPTSRYGGLLRAALSRNGDSPYLDTRDMGVKDRVVSAFTMTSWALGYAAEALAPYPAWLQESPDASS